MSKIFEKVKKRLSEKDSRARADIVIFVAIVMCMLFFLGFIPRTPSPARVARELSRHGHDVAGTYFTFAEDADANNHWIFKSSQPIYHDGEYFERWLVERRRSSRASRFFYYVITPVGEEV